MNFCVVSTPKELCIFYSHSNLDETTRSVYKENVRLNAALEYHVKEGQELKTVSY